MSVSAGGIALTAVYGVALVLVIVLIIAVGVRLGTRK